MELVKTSIQVIGYMVTWLVVFRGWRVNNEQNSRRDDRKELRDLVNDIAEAIRNVEADVVTYLTSADEAKTASYWTVQFGVKQVNAAIVSCNAFNTEKVSHLLVAYRQAITDKAVQGPDSKPLSGAQLNAALRGVSSSGTGLARGLETRYRELYPFSIATNA